MFYTGIGSRSAPKWATDLAKDIGAAMARRHWFLRSGGAGGMDEAFERGVAVVEKEVKEGLREIWVPWEGFRKKEHFDPSFRTVLTDELQEKARKILISTKVVKNYDHLKPSVKKLFARNVYQVVGKNGIDDKINHSLAVIYWAKHDEEGSCVGGTAIAVNLAKYLGIPTINLNEEKSRNTIIKRLSLKYRLGKYVEMLGY